VSKILVVDDDRAVRYMLSELLVEEGYEVASAENGPAALAMLDGVDVVLSDLVMPGMDGMSLLARLTAQAPDVPVILLTAQGNEKAAVRAMREGAFDYQSKPCDQDELLLSVRRALERRALGRSKQLSDAERRLARPLLGQSPAFDGLIELTRRVATRDISVLVQGETGVGKELIASLLHAHSSRKDGPLVRFNCGAIVESLAESELFGHEKGAFTGAMARHAGYFEQAHRGTLVLDEVAELPLGLQPKLLRALQSGEVRPIGATRSLAVDVRVVACTHRDLKHEVAAGRFREDLMYRLTVVTLRVPPLRERREDIPLLAEGFRRRFAQQFGLDDVPFDVRILQQLKTRDWPGNVRELENTIAGWLATSIDGRLSDDVALGETPRAAPRDGRERGNLRERVAEFERELLAGALVQAEGNHSEAARRLGVTRTTLLDKLKRHGLR
jgi:two-component system response regulator AtoC